MMNTSLDLKKTLVTSQSVLKVLLTQKVVIMNHKAELIPAKPRPASSDLMAKKNEELHSRLSKVEHHESELIGSGYFFYKTLYKLAKKKKSEKKDGKDKQEVPIMLKVPDSLVFGFGFKKPTLIYTNEVGALQFRKGIDHFQYDALLDVFQSLNMFQSRQGVMLPLLIVKIGNGRFNRVLLRRSDAYDEWRSREKNPEQCVMQHYLLPKGRKACKLRAVLRFNEFKLYTISSKRRLDGKRDPNPKQSLIAACGTLEEARRLYGTRFQPITNNSKGHVSRAPERKEENPITVTATFDTSPVDESFLQRFQDEFKVKIPLNDYSESATPDPEIEKIQDAEDPSKMRKNKLMPVPDFEINSTRLKARAEHYKEIEIDIEGMIEEQPEKKEKRKPPRLRAKVSEDSEEIDKLLADTKAGALETSSINRTKLYNHLLNIQDVTGEDRAFERTDNPLPGSYGIILRERYCTDTSDYKKTDIYEVRSKTMSEEVEAITRRLRSQVETLCSVGKCVQFSEFVCDFVEDINGNFWFLKLKSYSANDLGTRISRGISAKRRKPKRCAGSHCSEISVENKFEAFSQQQFQFMQKKDDLTTPRKAAPRWFMITKRLLIERKSSPTDESMEALLKPQLLDLVEVCSNCYNYYKRREAEAIQTEAKAKRVKTESLKQTEHLRKLISDVNAMTVTIDQQSYEAKPHFRSMSAIAKNWQTRPATTLAGLKGAQLSKTIAGSYKKLLNKGVLD